MTQPQRPTGKLYSSIYLRSDTLSEDSPRFRKRLERLLRALMPEHQEKLLATKIEGTLGVSVPRSQWDGAPLLTQFVEEAGLRDLLDTITLATFLLEGIGRKEKWIAGVGTILSEQQMAYEIDAEGGIHPFVDAEFSASKQATLRALTDSRFATARERFERACDLLRSDPSSAIEQAFKATENIFKQIYGGSKNRLNAQGVRA